MSKVVEQLSDSLVCLMVNYTGLGVGSTICPLTAVSGQLCHCPGQI